MKTKLLLSALTAATILLSSCSSPDDAALGSALLHGLAGAPTATFGQSMLLHAAGEGLGASGGKAERTIDVPSDLRASHAAEWWKGGSYERGMFYVFTDRFQFSGEDGGVLVLPIANTRSIQSELHLFNDFINFKDSDGLTWKFCFNVNRALLHEMVTSFQKKL